MALTVEELQIVLSCDATTAQQVLDKMDATVKAYTQKFQKYFQTKTGKVKPLSDVSKQVDKAAKDVESGTKRIKRAIKDMTPKSGSTGLTYKDIGRQAAQNVINSIGKYNPNYYQNSEREYQATFGPYSNANGGVPNLGLTSVKQDAEQAGEAVSSVGEKAYNFVMKSTDALIKVGRGIGTAFRFGLKGAFKTLEVFGKGITMVGGALKKAFQSSLLGKFLKRLGTVMLRMAAMKLIRGTIEGVQKGLEELAKHSASSAKAMNTISAAGGSIKMALGAAVMPLVKALAPLFVNLAGAINTACDAIARFFAVITGQGTYTATNFSSSLDGVSSSAGGAAKAVKRAVAAFDELNIIGDKNSGGGGGGSGVESSLSTVTDKIAFSDFAERLRTQILAGNWEGVGVTVNEKLNEVFVGIDNFFNDLSKRGYGVKLANFLNGLFSDPKTYAAAGSALASALNFVTTTINEFLSTFDVQRVVTAFTTLINTFVEDVDWMGIGANVGLIILDVLEFIFESLVGIDWAAVFRGIFDIVTNALATILSNPQRLVQLLKDMVLGLVDLVGGLIAGGLASIFDAFGLSGLADRITNAWDGAMDSINASLDEAISHINTSWTSTGNKAENAGNKAKNAFNDARTAINNTASAVGTLGQKITNLPENKMTTITVRVNTQGGSSNSSSGVNVNRPNININMTMASGGIAYGLTPAIIGEYAGAKSNPEVVAPLSDLLGILNKANVGGGDGKVSADQIRLLEEQNRLLRVIAKKELKLSPSAELGQVVSRSSQLYART